MCAFLSRILLASCLILAIASEFLTPCAMSQPNLERGDPVGSAPFLSQVARTVVARSDVGVLGTVARVTRFRGTTIGCIRVERVLHGPVLQPGAEITVMAGDPRYFGVPGNRIVVFACKFGRTQFRAFSRITLNSVSGQRRLEVLGTVLEIERLPESAFSRALKLKELFFRLLVDNVSDVRMLAIRELTVLSGRRADAFLRRDLARINQLDLMQSLPPSMRTQLKQLVDRLRRLPDRNEDRIAFHRRALEHASDEKAAVDALLSAVEELDCDALTILVTALQDSRPRIREIAALHLGRLGDPVAVPALMKQLRRESSAVVQATILDALGQLGATSAVEALVAAVQRVELRRSAILALARIGTADAIESLKNFRQEFALPGDSRDLDAVKLIDFVFSPRFKEQEANLKRLRKRAR